MAASVRATCASPSSASSTSAARQPAGSGLRSTPKSSGLKAPHGPARWSATAGADNESAWPIPARHTHTSEEGHMRPTVLLPLVVLATLLFAVSPANGAVFVLKLDDINGAQ